MVHRKGIFTPNELSTM